VVVLCSDAELKQHGLPLDYVDEVLLCGVSLPQPWLTAVNEYSNTCGVTKKGADLRLIPFLALGPEQV
jgi:hypothetical protein